MKQADDSYIQIDRVHRHPSTYCQGPQNSHFIRKKEQMTAVEPKDKLIRNRQLENRCWQMERAAQFDRAERHLGKLPAYVQYSGEGNRQSSG